MNEKNPFVVIGLVSLRAAALALVISGKSREADRLYMLAELLEAGQLMDEHMLLVAEKLKSRDITVDDWDELFQRIDRDRERLHG